MRRPSLVTFAFVTVFAAGCGSGDVSIGSGGAGGSGGAPDSTGSAIGGDGGSGGVASASGGDASSTGGHASGGGGNASGGGGGTGTPDPDLDGPYAVAEADDRVTASTGDALPIHCAYPTSGPEAGPYPVIIVGHGFQLPVTQYKSYLTRLASFGYVALTVDFPSSFTPNNVKAAKDLLAGVDWAASASALAGKADASKVGMTGHSLGGQLALLAATLDPRVKASITLDPVDGAMNCSAQDCPDVSSLMPIAIPTAFVGETVDASGGVAGMSCAPAADNYETFYARTTSPSLAVTVVGANHMSFLDDVASCGFICGFCNKATASNAKVNALAKAYVVAFYERHLRGNAAYDAYLTGAIAQARYVTPGLATLESR